VGTDPVGEHPSWCVRHFCTANQGRSGAHRSRPILVNDRPLQITAALYADAALPEAVLVEVTRNHVSLVLLPAAVAHNLGRVLTSLGAAAEGIGAVLGTMKDKPGIGG
jgi:hypothetical protein